LWTLSKISSNYYGFNVQFISRQKMTLCKISRFFDKNPPYDQRKYSRYLPLVKIILRNDASCVQRQKYCISQLKLRDVTYWSKRDMFTHNVYPCHKSYKAFLKNKPEKVSFCGGWGGVQKKRSCFSVTLLKLQCLYASSKVVSK
jgi:hypothetical protein